jgi:hypothetical protein
LSMASVGSTAYCTAAMALWAMRPVVPYSMPICRQGGGRWSPNTSPGCVSKRVCHEQALQGVSSDANLRHQGCVCVSRLRHQVCFDRVASPGYISEGVTRLRQRMCHKQAPPKGITRVCHQSRYRQACHQSMA